MSWVLHEDGIDLNGITLQSSILDYANALSAPGTFPTLAADAFYWKKTTLNPTPTDLDAYMVHTATMPTTRSRRSRRSRTRRTAAS